MAQAYGRSDIGYMHNNEQQQQPQQQQQQHTALGFSGVMMSGQQGSSLLSNGMHGGGMQQQQQQMQQQEQQQQQQGQGQGQQSQSQDGGDGQPAQAEYTLAGILHFLQSEWRRYERDRNEWEIERAEMRARIALLEGERKGTENLKTDLMRRVKMLEYALRQERNKYLSSSGNTTTATAQAPGSTVSGIPASKFATLQGLERAASSSGRSSPARADSAEASPPAEGPGVRGSTFSTVSFNPNTLFGGTINGSTIGGPGAALSRQPTTNSKDPRARAKSRDYLKQCLQEISYLTSASTLNPLPERAAGPASAGQARPRKTMPDVAPPTFQAPPAPEGAPPTQLQSPLTDSLNRRAGPPNAAANRRPIAPQGSSQPRAGPRGLGVGAASRPLHLSTEPLVEPLTEEPEQHGAPDVNAAAQAEHGNAADPLGATQHHAEESTEQAEEAAATPYYVEGDAPPPAPSAGVTDLPEESSRSTNDERGEEQEDEDQVTAVFRGAGGDPANANASDWAKLKEAGQREREKRERMRQAQQGAAGGAPDAAALALTSERVAALIKASSGNAQSTPGSKADDEELASLTMVEPDAGAAATARTDEEAAGTMWKSKVVLRSHLDAVRAIAFDGTDVVSASDDKTIKFWRLDLAALEAPGTRASADTEPIVTLRGHTAPVTCLAVASNARRLYSGAMDASIRVWRLPDRSTTPYPPFENRELATLVGHTQAVWDMALLPLAEEGAVLASASADGTVKIWNTTPEPASLRLSWDYFGTEASDEAEAARASGKPLPVPTSVSVVHSDLRVCAVAYSNSVVKLFDVESGRQVMQLKSDETYDGTPARQINKVVTHPTLPILVTAHEDQYIRMFDLTTGACTLSQLAHLDAVTSLDIDPAGLTLVSGSNDLSLRFWDVNFSEKAPKAVCVQEMTAHRPKGGEGVLAVLYHPTAPFFFSAAADGCLRAYG